MEYGLGWANLLATYSYIKSESTISNTMSFSPALPWDALGPSEHREHSGEIRLTTQLEGAWNFLGGLYAEDLDDEVFDDYAWYGSPESLYAGILPGFYGEVRNQKQKAAFGEVSWQFLPSFTLTGGVRAYKYDRTGQTDWGGPLFGGVPPPADVSTDASGTSFRGNLSYKPNDNALIYAGWSQGFRLGIPQSGLPPGVCDANPADGIVDGTSNLTIESTRRLDSDNVDNYEIGGKFTLLDRRLLIAADVYRIDWTGLPVRTFAPARPEGCGLVYSANAGAARSEGIEFQANFYVTEAFRVDVGGSWIRAELTKNAPAIGAFDGDRLPGSPKVNANLGLQYEFDLGDYNVFMRADSIYVGPFYGAMQEPPAGSVPAGDYVKVDASARVTIRNTDIDLFVRNLTNADDFTFRGSGNPVEPLSGFRLRPRTIGVQLAYNF
jgi:outer membrane receptor protein involved in Fe transport